MGKKNKSDVENMSTDIDVEPPESIASHNNSKKSFGHLLVLDVNIELLELLEGMYDGIVMTARGLALEKTYLHRQMLKSKNPKMRVAANLLHKGHMLYIAAENFDTIILRKDLNDIEDKKKFGEYLVMKLNSGGTILATPDIKEIDGLIIDGTKRIGTIDYNIFRK